MEEPRDTPQAGRPQPERPDIRPLSRRATRIFVVVAVLLVIALAFSAAYLLVDTAEEADVPAALQEETAPDRAP